MSPFAVSACQCALYLPLGIGAQPHPLYIQLHSDGHFGRFAEFIFEGDFGDWSYFFTSFMVPFIPTHLAWPPTSAGTRSLDCWKACSKKGCQAGRSEESGACADLRVLQLFACSAIFCVRCCTKVRPGLDHQASKPKATSTLGVSVGIRRLATVHSAGKRCLNIW